jgi:uncharacterized protein
MSMDIVLDTNFLMIPGQLKVDIFSEIDRIIETKYTLHVHQGTFYELQKIRETGSGKDKAAAKLALDLIKAKNINIIGNLREKNVDDELVLLAKEGYFVATSDKALRKRIGQRLLVLRQKKYVKVL